MTLSNVCVARDLFKNVELSVGARPARDEVNAVFAGTEVPVSRASFAPTDALAPQMALLPMPCTPNRLPGTASPCCRGW
ncbi:hypothetical protein EMIT043CA1_60378 [Pseudomonas brassicacearum]